MFGLPLRPSIKSSVSPSRTDFHAENERALRLTVSSFRLTVSISLDDIY